LSLVYSVVCQQLGFGDAVRIYSFGYFGSGSSSMPIWLDDVQCNIGDQYLSECSHNGWGINNCMHFGDVGVSCTGTGVIVTGYSFLAIKL